MSASHTSSRKTSSLPIMAFTAIAALCGAIFFLSSCAGFSYSNQTVTAQVESINGSEITVQLGEFGASGPERDATGFDPVDARLLEVGNAEVYTVPSELVSSITDPAPVMSLGDAMTTISLDDDQTAIEGVGATCSTEGGRLITISQGGCYALTGTLSQGSIKIACSDEVILLMNEVEITASGAPAIGSDGPVDLIMTFIDQTNTSLASDQTVIDLDGALVMNGSGSLELTSEKGGGVKIGSEQDAAGLLSLENGFYTLDVAEHGFDASQLLSLSGGNYTISAGSDGLHSDADGRVTGGVMTITCGDDGFHSDKTLVIDGGNVTVAACEEGYEAEKVYLRGSTTAISSADDGVNASAPEAYADSQPEGYSEKQSCFIGVGDGLFTINAGGDGIDSNGSFQMNGGALLVSGSDEPDNSALDYDVAGVLMGGVALFTGSAEMAQGFTEVHQPYVATEMDGDGGAVLSLLNTEGGTLADFTPARSYGMVTATTPALINGQFYELAAEGTVLDASESDMVEGGAIQGGAVVEVQATEIPFTMTPSGAPGEAQTPPDAPQALFIPYDDAAFTITIDSALAESLHQGDVIELSFGEGSEGASLTVLQCAEDANARGGPPEPQGAKPGRQADKPGAPGRSGVQAA